MIARKQESCELGGALRQRGLPLLPQGTQTPLAFGAARRPPEKSLQTGSPSTMHGSCRAPAQAAHGFSVECASCENQGGMGTRLLLRGANRTVTRHANRPVPSPTLSNRTATGQHTLVHGVHALKLESGAHRSTG